MDQAHKQDEALKEFSRQEWGVTVKPGDLIGNRYRVEQFLGRGGMSQVFKCQDMLLHRTVALKQILPGQAEVKQSTKRMRQEAIAVSKLNHPNILRLHELVLPELGEPYMIMDYLDGRSLEAALAADGAFSIERTLELSEKLCSALEHAHEKGIVHRDLKPSNIILTGRAGAEAKIVDFGIARILENTAETKLTKTGEVVGTPQYMSPEQCHGSDIGPASDQYSLACIVFRCLTGVVPFQAGNVIGTVLKQMQETAPTLKEASGKRFPEHIESAVARALSKVPQERFRSVSEFHRALLGKSSQDRALPAAASGTQSNASFLAYLIVGAVTLTAVASYFAIRALTGESARPASTVSNQPLFQSALPGPGDNEGGKKSANSAALPDLTALDSGDFRIAELNKTQPYRKSFMMTGFSVSDNGLRSLTYHPTPITELGLADSGSVTDVGIKYITGFPLEKLILSNTSITRASIPELAKIGTLKELQLHGITTINDADVATLAKLKHLQVLSLNYAAVTDASMPIIAGMKELQQLQLNHTRITNKGVSFLVKMPKLQILCLRAAEVDDGVLQSLQKMPYLAFINLATTSITDKTIRGLEKNKKLSGLVISSCDQITPQAIAHFKAALPKCLVKAEQERGF